LISGLGGKWAAKPLKWQRSCASQLLDLLVASILDTALWVGPEERLLPAWAPGGAGGA
jgi:hypothetical protein